MKALSLTQPWAHVILHHGKRIENRTWSGCAYRGAVLLHAAKSVGTRDDFNSCMETILGILKPAPGQERLDVVRPMAEMRVGGRGIHHASGWWSPAPELQRGGIVGRARVVDVINEGEAFGYGADQERWWFGGFALVLDDVEPLPFVAWKGALGFFDVPNDYAEIAARAAEARP